MAKRRTCECKHFGCYKLTDNKNGYCDEHQNEYYEKQAKAKKNWIERTGYKYKKNYALNKYEKFYSSKQWQEMRAYILARDNYLCQDCLKNNKIVNARQVHHIDFLTHNWDKRLDEDNLVSLCNDCHKKRHGKKY